MTQNEIDIIETIISGLQKKAFGCFHLAAAVPEPFDKQLEKEGAFYENQADLLKAALNPTVNRISNGRFVLSLPDRTKVYYFDTFKEATRARRKYYERRK